MLAAISRSSSWSNWSTTLLFFFSSRRRHTRFDCDWSSDVCSSDLQRSALRVGELRLQELGARYGRDVLVRAMDEIIERTEANMRAAIRAVPDGVYTDRKSVV